MKLIEAKNISYKINDRNILNNISFVIDFGELVKISGDNGSGKTTLLKIIIGLTKQTKGELINHNEDKDAKPFPSRSFDDWDALYFRQ